MSAVVLVRGLKSHFVSRQLEENGYHTKVSSRISCSYNEVIFYRHSLTACCNNRGLFRRQKNRLPKCGRPLLLYKRINQLRLHRMPVPTIAQWNQSSR